MGPQTKHDELTNNRSVHFREQNNIFAILLPQTSRTAAARLVDAGLADLPGGFGSAPSSSLDPPRVLLAPGRVTIPEGVNVRTLGKSEFDF